MPSDTHIPNVRCQACGSQLRIKPALVGKTIACPCGQRLQIPVRATPISAAASKPQHSRATAQPTSVNKPAAPEKIVSCEKCGRKLRAPAAALGKAIRCPCSQIVPVPDNRVPDNRVPDNPNDDWLNALPTPSPSARVHQAAPAAISRPKLNTPLAPDESGTPSAGNWLDELSTVASSPSIPATSSNSPYAPPAEHAIERYGRSPANAGYRGGGQAEGIRLKHLRHETAIHSLGSLHRIGGFFSLLYVTAGIVLLAAPTQFLPPDVSAKALLAIRIQSGILIVIFSAVAAFYFWLGSELQKFTKPAKTAGTIVFSLGLLGFPLGTLVSAYFLWLLNSEKGTLIFSKEYRRIIRDTPHIKRGMSILLIAMLVILAILLLIALLSLIMAAINAGG